MNVQLIKSFYFNATIGRRAMRGERGGGERVKRLRKSIKVKLTFFSSVSLEHRTKHLTLTLFEQMCDDFSPRNFIAHTLWEPHNYWLALYRLFASSVRVERNCCVLNAIQHHVVHYSSFRIIERLFSLIIIHFSSMCGVNKGPNKS